MKKIKLFTIVLSLILGFTGTCAFARYMPTPQPTKASCMAWWGALYPEYGMSDAFVRVEGEEKDAGEEVHINIRFKYLTFLNGSGGNNE